MHLVKWYTQNHMATHSKDSIQTQSDSQSFQPLLNSALIYMTKTPLKCRIKI